MVISSDTSEDDDHYSWRDSDQSINLSEFNDSIQNFDDNNYTEPHQVLYDNPEILLLNDVLVKFNCLESTFYYTGLILNINEKYSIHYTVKYFSL